MSTPFEETLNPLVHEPAPLRNKIMNSLRKAIETGALEPGTRLVEKDLCEKLNVSRTSLREALRQLQAEGVLTDHNNRGLTVVTVTRSDADNIYRIRGVLEPLIVEQFIENAPDEEIEALKKQSERLKKAYLEGNAEEIVATKREFYDRICTGARNPIAFDLLKKLTLLTSPLRRSSVVRPERRNQSIQEIDAIVAGIAARDRDAAKAAAETHVANAAVSAFRIAYTTS